MIYGVFGFCPDCREHNSLQILDKNLELVLKMLDMAQSAEGELLKRMVENSHSKTAFQHLMVSGEKSAGSMQKNPRSSEGGESVFPKSGGAKQNFNGFSISTLLQGLAMTNGRRRSRLPETASTVCHKMGVMDYEYVRKSGDIRDCPGPEGQR